MENTNIEELLKLYNFEKLSEVQEKVIPKALKGESLIVESVTGTGKTHAFLFPIFMNIDKDNHHVQAIISSPTRELARQIYEMSKPMSEFLGIDTRLYVGGDDLNKAITRLEKEEPYIMIGTPGRLNQLIVEKNLININLVKTFIIDEADMTMDQGFIPLVDSILEKANKDASFQIYSATIKESMEPFFKKYLSNPEIIKVNKKDLTPLNITHYFLKTKYRDKVELLKEVMSAINPYLCMIYLNTKEEVIKLYKEFKDDPKVCAMHGDLEADKRKKLMKEIRSLKYTYVISTDLTARGLDIDGISHVINYSLPDNDEFYIHRTGRTGRMFKDGIAISFYDLEDDEYLDDLEKKGLSCDYIVIKNNELVKTKERNARNRKDFYKSKINVQAQEELRKIKTISKKVKPNYKKKYNWEVKEQKNKIIQRNIKKMKRK